MLPLQTAPTCGNLQMQVGSPSFSSQTPSFKHGLGLQGSISVKILIRNSIYITLSVKTLSAKSGEFFSR